MKQLRILTIAALGASFMCGSSAADTAPVAAVASQPQPAVAVPAVDPVQLAAISSKLNSVRTLKASFTQTDTQGTTTGRFYLARPGGLRFEYDPPRKLLVVADNTTVMVQENPNVDGYRVKVDDTPLRLLLKPGVDLSRDAKITDLRTEQGVVYLTAVQTDGYGQGKVTFAFSEPTLDLQRWVVTDALGVQTMVTLNNQQAGVELSKRLFEIPRVKSGIGPIR